MEELESLANSRARAKESELARKALPPPPAAQLLKWPLRFLGIVLVPSIVFAVAFLSPGGGHPAPFFVLVVYLFFLVPIAAPIGLGLSAAAFITHRSCRGKALLLMAIFVLATIASWIWFLPIVRAL